MAATGPAVPGDPDRLRHRPRRPRRPRRLSRDDGGRRRVGGRRADGRYGTGHGRRGGRPLVAPVDPRARRRGRAQPAHRRRGAPRRWPRPGLFRMAAPAVYGGGELHPVEIIKGDRGGQRGRRVHRLDADDRRRDARHLHGALPVDTADVDPRRPPRRDVLRGDQRARPRPARARRLRRQRALAVRQRVRGRRLVLGRLHRGRRRRRAGARRPPPPPGAAPGGRAPRRVRGARHVALARAVRHGLARRRARRGVRRPRSAPPTSTASACASTRRCSACRRTAGWRSTRSASPPASPAPRSTRSSPWRRRRSR